MTKKNSEIVDFDSPYVIEEDSMKQVETNNEAITDTDKDFLTYKSPRLFRKSLIFKTWNLFRGPVEEKSKLDRPLKEKYVLL